MYYSTDTHWNLAGGLAAYQVLIDTIRKDFPCIHPVREADFTINTFFNEEGDLARNCELEHIFRRKEYQLTFKNGSRQLHMPESSALEIRYHQNDVTDCSNLKLLMFRDSYANYLIPFLNLHFREATYVWSYDFLDELIENEKPDVVIFESLQRFMTYSLRIQNAERVVHNN